MLPTNPLEIIMLGPGLDVKGGISIHEKLFLKYAPPEVHLKHISTKEDGSSWLKIRVFLKALVKLVWVLITEKIDLVHIQGSHRGSAFRQAFLTLVVKVFRKPLVLQTHASEFHLFYANLPPWLQKFIAWTFSQGDRFIVLSKSWREFYTTHLGLQPDKVTLLYNPVKVPTTIAEPSEPASEIKLLFLGRIGKRKGTFDLIEAFARLDEGEKTNSKVIIAGDGDLDTAKDLAASLNLADRVVFPGWVDTKERNRLLNHTDIFVLPSYNEGLPLSMLEAMAWALPTIATPVGGIEEIINDGENGLLVEPGNIEQLSNTIKSLIGDRNLRSTLGTNGRKSIIPLDINKYWLSFLNIYQSAVGVTASST